MRQQTIHESVERFFSHVNQYNDISLCWFWQGVRVGTYKEYGKLTYNKKSWLAHKWFYEYIHGPVPYKFELDHVCKNKICVNPSHLEIVTRKENLDRGLKKSLIVCCPKGHEYTPENTNIQTRMYDNVLSEMRSCRKCAKIRHDAYNVKRKRG